jgi:class 3 adenylate cyclase
VLLRLSAICLVIAIFVVDTFVRLEFAVAVLYVVVVLIMSMSRDRSAVILAGLGCSALTVLSLVLVHRMAFPDAAILRASMSLAAIAITTILTLRNLSAGERLAVIESQRKNLARFFSPQLVDELAAIDTPLSVTRNQPAAVMFADIVGFTDYASNRSPEEVIALIRDLQSILGSRVFANNGMIDKFLGDGLIAVFGLPHPGAHDVADAVQCALDILREVDRWNRQRTRAGEQPLRIAVGIHYGHVVQGDIGGESRLELTVVGDTVNVASRVESHCRNLGFDLLITAAVIAELHAEGSVVLAERFVDLGLHTLRGRTTPISLSGLRGRPNLQKFGHGKPIACSQNLTFNDGAAYRKASPTM